ncbi:MAG: carbohydrate ABC transporter permease, partial [Nitrospinota bacterium]
MSERKAGWLLVIPAFAFIAIFALYPVGRTLWLSFHRHILVLPELGESFVGLANYRRLLQDPSALDSLAFTVGFVLLSTLLELLLGLGVALVLHRQFRGRGWVRAAALVPWALPTVVASQMWRFMLNDQYGLVNRLLFGTDVAAYPAWLADPWGARAAILVADVWKTTPFAAILLLAGLQTIPEELYEAASVDGAGPWKRFFSVTLPMLRPALLVALLFRTIDAFRVFDLVFVMTQGGPGGATSVLQFYGYK